MKMNFRHDRSWWQRRNLIQKIGIGFATIVLVVLFFMHLDTIAVTLSAPFVRIASVIPGVSDMGMWIRNQQDLLAENKQLRLQVQDAEDALAVEAAILKENAALSALLGRKDAADNLLLAHVLSGPGNAPYDTMIVDAGSNLGVNVGDIVLAGPHTLLGSVINVYGTQAKIELYSSYGSTLHAVAGPDQHPIDIAGAGGGNFTASVPDTQGVIPGDLVLIPSLGSKVIGVVGSVERAKDISLNNVLLQIPINIFSLDRVYIITRP
jgi:cell shape-determining protein MreC